jgi:Lar family restriction alleviation protein
MALDLAMAMAMAMAPAMAMAMALDLALALALAMAMAMALDLAMAMALDLALAMAMAMALDLAMAMAMAMAPANNMEVTMKTDRLAALLPCPFCGGEAKLWEGDWANNDHGVVCTKCEVTLDPCNTIYIEDGGETSEQYATRAWNTRALTATVDREIVEAANYHHYSRRRPYPNPEYRKQLDILVEYVLRLRGEG